MLLLWERWETVLNQSCRWGNRSHCESSVRHRNCKTHQQFDSLSANDYVSLLFTLHLLFTLFHIILCSYHCLFFLPLRQDSDLLVISILDENDNRPVFTRTSYRAEIMENSAAGSSFPWGGGNLLCSAGQRATHCLKHCLLHFLTLFTCGLYSETGFFHHES